MGYKGVGDCTKIHKWCGNKLLCKSKGYRGTNDWSKVTCKKCKRLR